MTPSLSVLPAVNLPLWIASLLAAAATVLSAVLGVAVRPLLNYSGDDEPAAGAER